MRMIKVNVKKSRMWIPAAGFVLALGFMNNCMILPYLEGGETISWFNLITTFAVMLGLGGVRDFVLRKFSYLGPVLEKNKALQEKGRLTNKTWIPIIGWCIVGGLFNNCCIYPFFKIGLVDWTGLWATLSILLTISGAREWGIYAEDRRALEKQGVKTDVQPTDEAERISSV